MTDTPFGSDVRSAASWSEPRVFRSAMEVAGEAVVVTSAELDAPGPRILYVNPAFTRMTGYAPEEVLGQTPRMLQGPGTDRTVLDRMRVDLASTGQFHGEAVNYAKDGTPYVIDWLITGARDETGRVTEWVSVQRDVTGRKALEERHDLLLGELQHRVRNNLAVIRSIVRRSTATSASVEEQATHLNGRLDVFARVQSLVTQDPGTWIDLSRLISDELNVHAAHEGEQVRTSGPSVRLRPRTAERLGLALHELASERREVRRAPERPGTGYGDMADRGDWVRNAPDPGMAGDRGSIRISSATAQGGSEWRCWNRRLPMSSGRRHP